MDYIWSPWRYRFIAQGAPKDSCVFCGIAAEPEKDDENFVVRRAAHNFVILNLYPYTSGHLMIVPYEHVAELAAASVDATDEMMRLARATERALREAYNPNGMNFGMNLGAAAGAGIAGHIHMHAVARWMGDANFLSVIGETRMLPEELSVTRDRLRAKFDEISPRV